MKSGLEGRNNHAEPPDTGHDLPRLNEVRPRRPEQSARCVMLLRDGAVSMKSGLEGRNNG